MIELSQTMPPPAPAQKPAPIPGMLTAQEYLIAAGGVLSAGSDRPGFLQEVKTAIPVGVGQARCHYYKYQGTWQTANANWVAIIRKLTIAPPPTLPKTGY